MTEVHDLSALEQAAAMRRKEFSPLELLEHYQRRTEALDETVGAFVTRTDELAHQQAYAAEQRILAADADEPLGPLFGAVVPVKDLNLVAGVRTRLGSVTYDLRPDTDDDVVARMRAGGLVITGKTNTPEFGLPCYTEPAVAPAARTPWDLSRSAGGSSGGAAAAVSAGLASAAQGSDGGGSIRIPASVTGLVGVKPARGRIGNGPAPDGLGELAQQGVLARTVGDAAALLDLLAGGSVGDLVPAPVVAAGSFLAASATPPGRLRVGRYATPVIAETEVAAPCLAAYEQASLLLDSLGHDVEDVTPPFGPWAVPSFEAVWSVMAASVPVDAADEQRLQPLTRWLRERGRSVSGVGLAAAVSVMRSLTRLVVAATASYDAVLTPTLAALPAAVGGIRDDDDPAADFQAQKRFTPFTSPYNITGLPAVSLPLHWATVPGTDGRDVTLPVGVQFVGRPYQEAVLLSLAAQLEQAAPWRDHRPPLW